MGCKEVNTPITDTCALQLISYEDGETIVKVYGDWVIPTEKAEEFEKKIKTLINKYLIKG